MKITVLGSTGMLGRYVTKYFSRCADTKVVPLTRDDLDASNVSSLDIDRALHLPYGSSLPDLVINCTGVIKSRVYMAPFNTVKVNSIFPHLLADVCEYRGIDCLHVTTDCVFDGTDGPYCESDPHSAVDLYGMSKSAGEPDNCAVIRTSIIGEELNQARCLVEWAKNHEGLTVNGFTNHLWNGLTCLELCRVIDILRIRNQWWSGVRHIYSPRFVTKCDLLTMISEVYNLAMTIIPVETPTECDRRLYSECLECSVCTPIYQQIKDMKNFRI